VSLRVLVAPSGFKGSASAREVADAIAAGILRAMPDARVHRVPLVDGGEDFARGLVEAVGGHLHDVTVTGPLGTPVPAYFGFLDRAATGGVGTAVMEMSAAAGLRLVPRDRRDPLRTTTYGVGELIRAALDAGAERILLGCGDSGTCDGGVGAAQALGVRLLDAAGGDIGRGGAALERLETIDLAARDRRLDRVPIDVACNWENVLCGDRGVAPVYGPQKGASPGDVATLAAALECFAAVVRRQTGIDVRSAPGGGASGGLGAGLHALLGATLHPRFDVIARFLRLDDYLGEVDLVITAEGELDSQTPQGKVPVEVARQAKLRGLPVVLLAGRIGPGAHLSLTHGIDAFDDVLHEPVSLDEAMAQAQPLIEAAAERIMRFVMVGSRLPRRG
jgi:glycerate kinase